MLSPLLLLGTVLSLLFLASLYIPKQIPSIPHRRISSVIPYLDLFSLGVAYITTFEVFRWFSRRGHYHQHPIFQVILPFMSLSHPVVVLTDPVEIRELVTRRLGDVDRSKAMAGWFDFMAPGASIGMSSFGREGIEFRRKRWLWNGMLAPDFMADAVAPRIWEAARLLVELWRLKTASASRISTGDSFAFEASQDLRRGTSEAMMGVLLNRELGALGTDITYLKNAVEHEQKRRTIFECRKSAKATFPNGEYSHFYSAFNLCLMCLEWITGGTAPSIWYWFFRHVFPPSRKALPVVDEYLQSVIDETRRQVTNDARKETPCTTIPRSALELVLKRASTKPDTEAAVSDEALKSELIELLITGHETTASTIGWALKYLADNQQAQHLLHQALVASLKTDNGHLPSSEAITKTQIPYLDAFIAEVLRISCTGPISFREAIRDCTILGHHIPAGTPVVLMTQDTTHLSSRPKPRGKIPWAGRAFPSDQFAPERWLTSTGEYYPDAELSLPFSAGARGCFGQKIAITEMRIMITVFVLNFHFPCLMPKLSRYTSWDGLTRKPSCCYVQPIPRSIAS